MHRVQRSTLAQSIITQLMISVASHKNMLHVNEVEPVDIGKRTALDSNQTRFTYQFPYRHRACGSDEIIGP